MFLRMARAMNGVAQPKKPPGSPAASTVDEYLASHPDDRREAISAVRDVVNANLPEGYVESEGFGMIGWGIPLEDYPDTYNKEPPVRRTSSP